MTRRIAVLSAGLSDPSSTRLLADRLADATRTALAIRGQQSELPVVELRPLAHDITNAMLTGFSAGPLTAALDTVAGADALIAVSPTFLASYSGLFKSFLDVLTIDHADGLRGVPVLLGATAGTARHSLVLESALRPLFGYLGALSVPTGVFAASEDWGSTGSAGSDGELSARIERAGAELAELTVGRSPRRRPADPGSPGKTGTPAGDDPEVGDGIDDGFGDGIDFSALLSR